MDKLIQAKIKAVEQIYGEFLEKLHDLEEQQMRVIRGFREALKNKKIEAIKRILEK